MKVSQYMPFVLLGLGWQVAMGIIYGLLFGYNQDTFIEMLNVTGTYKADSTLMTIFQHPFPLAVIAMLLIFLLVGFGSIAAYVRKSSLQGIAYTLLLFAFTIQNYFLFRAFWHKINVNNGNTVASFDSTKYNLITYVNYLNDRQINSDLQSASFFDAIGCALAIYAGYSTVIGRIGLLELLFLSTFGGFIYEVSNQILWRLYMVDNGFPVRAFGFGGALGIFSSLFIPKKKEAINSGNYYSTYSTMSLAFLGAVFAWCTYPVFALSSVFTRTANPANAASTNLAGKSISMVGQVNIWLSLAASILGCFTACAFVYKRYSVHHVVFASLSGGIAFMASTDINFNPGAALAIGYIASFLTTLLHYFLTKRINQNGIIETNSVTFFLFVPAFLASVCAAILQAVNQTAFTGKSIDDFTVSYANLRDNNLSNIQQGGYQVAGFGIAAGLGMGAGIIVGLFYRFFGRDYENQKDILNDSYAFCMERGQNKVAEN